MKAKRIAYLTVPLLIMALGSKLFYATTLLIRARAAMLRRERNSSWARSVLGPEGGARPASGEPSLRENGAA